MDRERRRQAPDINALPTFSELFERYSANTDGKEKIAEYINAIGEAKPGALLIDFGAGDGRLTRRLLRGFDNIIAVEKHESFRPSLAAIPGVCVVASKIEDFTPPRPYDVGLLSYSLSGIPKQRFYDTVKRFLDRRGERGQLLFVTFVDGCDWDLWANGIAKHLNVPRRSGLARHQEQLESFGFPSRVVTTWESSIWGENSDALYRNLGFFFYRNIADYLQDQSKLKPLLEEFQSWDGVRMNLSVQEAIVEILPL
jgi:hypothetical protein